MIDTTKLRELAQKAEPLGLHIYNHPRDSNNWKANDEYIKAVKTGDVLALLDDLDALNETIRHMRIELEKLRPIKDAAENLVKVRGRHHSELAYQQLERALK